MSLRVGMRVVAALSGGVDSAVAAARLSMPATTSQAHLALAEMPVVVAVLHAEDVHDARRAADISGSRSTYGISRSGSRRPCWMTSCRSREGRTRIRA